MKRFLFFPKRKKAVSLYELLIVMSIIIIVAAIVIPRLQDYVPSLKLSSSAQEVSTKLREAQEEAVTTQIKHGIQFNVNTATDPASIDFFKFVEAPPPIPPTVTVLENIQLPKDITLTLDSAISGNSRRANSIIFSADGGPDVNGNIIVGLTDDGSKTINVSPAGVIKLLLLTPTPTPAPTSTPTPSEAPTDTQFSVMQVNPATSPYTSGEQTKVFIARFNQHPDTVTCKFDTAMPDGSHSSSATAVNDTDYKCTAERGSNGEGGVIDTNNIIITITGARAVADAQPGIIAGIILKAKAYGPSPSPSSPNTASVSWTWIYSAPTPTPTATPTPPPPEL